MNIIIPMAGMGKRLRPHTLTVPKPLIPIAGKPIVQHLVEDIAEMVNEKLERIVFVTGRFGPDVERHLLDVARQIGAKGEIVYQDEALGTAHAVWCAKDALDGPTIVAFADTLFRSNFKLDPTKDGVLWVKQIEDPSAFGVVTLDDEGHITGFVEKPQTFVSDLAMIGIYYFREGADLYTEIAHLMNHHITKGGEYQLPDALRRMTERGAKFVPGEVRSWMDCGNPEVTIQTNKEVLAWKYPNSSIESPNLVENAQIIPPCYIGTNTVIRNASVGPYVSIGANSVVEDSRITSSLIQSSTTIMGANLDRSMIGNFVKITNFNGVCSIGDYSVVE